MDKTTKSRKRFLLGQLVSHGDCLYATAVAKQIKKDYPGCHLTWAISSYCRAILDGNPDVDEIWEIPMENTRNLVEDWKQFEMRARERKRKGEFDDLFLTQYYPENLHHFDGLSRTTIFRGYPRPVTVPVNPVIRLREEEIRRVKEFAETYQLDPKKGVILFECSARSGQSFVTPDFALQTSHALLKKNPNLTIILSSNQTIESGDHRIIDGSRLTFRENAELTRYCSLLVGCSSGISWLCTSDWAIPLPTVQLLRKGISPYASFVQDFKYRGVSTESIIEMTDCSAERVAGCLSTIFSKSFREARDAYHEANPPTFNVYTDLFVELIKRKRPVELFQLIGTQIRRYGINARFIGSHFELARKAMQAIWLRSKAKRTV